MDKNTILVYQIGSNMARMSPKWWTFVPSDTTTERELLSIVEALKEFRNILLGQQIIVHTADHKNLTHGTFTCDRVMPHTHVLILIQMSHGRIRRMVSFNIVVLSRMSQ